MLKWNVKGLPTDKFSVENGILVTKAQRVVLMIDPQLVAKNWIKKLESDRNLQVRQQSCSLLFIGIVLCTHEENFRPLIGVL